MKEGGKIGPVMLAVVCAAFIGLRFWRLTDSCLWFDEMFGVHAALMDVQALFRFVAQDLIHPPLFYVLLKLWIAIGGEGLFWLRCFPVLFSVLGLVPLILLCRELKLDYPTIAVAVLFLAANGCLIKYSQEVRMYSLLLFFGLLSGWLFVRFLNLGKNIWLLTIVNVLLIYTHYFGWLAVFSEALAIVVLQRIKIRQMLIMIGLLGLAFAPWVLALWRAVETAPDVGQNLGWIEKPSLIVLARFLSDLIEPFYFQQSTQEPATLLAVSLPIGLLLLTALTIYLIDLNGEAETIKRNLVLLAIFILPPVSIALLASLVLPYSVWGTRHLIIVFAPFAVVAASAVTRVRPPALVGIFLGSLLLIYSAAFYIQANRQPTVYVWCAWARLAGSLDQTKPAKIYAFEDRIAYEMWFALRGAPVGFEIVKVGGIEGIAEDPAYFLPRGFDGVKTTDENGISGDRFFVAFRDSDFNEKHPPLRNLVNEGYRIGHPEIVQTPGLKAILVEVSK